MGIKELSDVLKECTNLRQSIKIQQSSGLRDPIPDLLCTLPTKDVCDELVCCYMRTFELIYRIVHIPSFWKDYQQFWAQPQSVPRHFVMKLLLILALGTTFYSDQSGSQNI